MRFQLFFQQGTLNFIHCTELHDVVGHGAIPDAGGNAATANKGMVDQPLDNSQLIPSVSDLIFFTATMAAAANDSKVFSSCLESFVHLKCFPQSDGFTHEQMPCWTGHVMLDGDVGPLRERPSAIMIGHHV